MLIPMGILAASGAGAAPAYELISTVTADGSSSTITFSSIPNTYKSLQLRYVAKCSPTNQFSVMGFLRFNNDSGSNYWWHSVLGTGSVGADQPGSTQNRIVPGYIAASYSTMTGVVTPAIIDITDYASANKNKTVRVLTGHASGGQDRMQATSGVWINTSAISTLSLVLDQGNGAANYLSTSRFSLYGLKG